VNVQSFGADARHLVRAMLSPALAAALLAPVPGYAQRPDDHDAVLARIRAEGMERSQLEPLAQTLMDSVGPRLTGTPGQAAAHDWAVSRYAAWGIPARTEPYGTWPAWERGTAHVDLIAPRVRSLEARLLAWSPGTGGPSIGPVVALPDAEGPDAFRAWLGTVEGAYVLLSAEPVTCRPAESWARWALPATLERMQARARAAEDAVPALIRQSGLSPAAFLAAIEGAGAAGVLLHRWSGGWGTSHVQRAPTRRAPAIDVSCEDYGLLHRLARNGQQPVLRVDADARFTGQAPAANTIAEIRGRERPGEYVILSAHFDSWDAASGATDNGTGTVVMMEAMRILRRVYPAPRRTILAGHWGGEEQGLNGSRAFVEDNPAIVEGLHVLFNQDTGTGRIDRISLQGFAGAGPTVRRWLAALPGELAEDVELDDPGFPSAGSSDHAAFVCAGKPGFWLLSTSWDYGTYTWHTDRDTFDKVSFDDLRRNAVLVAMLAYLAAEAAERMPTARRELPVDPRTGAPGTWPACVPADRSGW
jgi:carboxypeptidase Q